MIVLHPRSPCITFASPAVTRPRRTLTKLRRTCRVLDFASASPTPLFFRFYVHRAVRIGLTPAPVRGDLLRHSLRMTLLRTCPIARLPLKDAYELPLSDGVQAVRRFSSPSPAPSPPSARVLTKENVPSNPEDELNLPVDLTLCTGNCFAN